MDKRILLILIIVLSSVTIDRSFAHGPVVDKVNHPYVLPNEREVEWRLVSRDKEGRAQAVHRLGLGYALSEYVTLEGHMTAQREDNAFKVLSYEMELRWMITDQGKYWSDWGMLFELEKEKDHHHWEVSSAILFEKEFGKTSFTANLFGQYEWGEDADNGWESEFRAKYRYRWKPEIQPAVEVYVGEDLTGIGPAFMGIRRFVGQKQLKWEMGLIFDLDNAAGGDETLRISLEYEF